MPQWQQAQHENLGDSHGSHMTKSQFEWPYHDKCPVSVLAHQEGRAQLKVTLSKGYRLINLYPLLSAHDNCKHRTRTL